ncbi:MAG TPA: aldose epimerase family protein [Vicinamibacterales bacterium]|nr:aldose epimerase family protein [Vicinamibacterales bacterium]
MSITRQPFGTDAEGRPVDLFVLDSGSIELHAISLGAIITSLRVPDRSGRREDVVLGHDTLAPYLTNPPYVGAVVGRYANRIANGRFTLDGQTYALATNDGPNHLHGGRRGFDKHVWEARTLTDGSEPGVEFSRVSPDGEEGYPGNLHVSVSYRLNDRVVDIRYEATTDTPTVINLTQHSYFNLAGPASADVLAHELLVHADSYTPVNATLIPTGEITAVNGTPFDLRRPAIVGERLRQPHEQLRIANGLDHNLVVAGRPGTLRPAAVLHDRTSGRRIEVSTTEPGVQVYTGQSLSPSITGAYGRRFAPHTGMCLETQHYPDSPNHQNFPTTVLRPGERWRSHTRWRFTIA